MTTKYQYHSANYLRKYNTDEFYNEIIAAVGKKIKRDLRPSEQNETVSFIRKLDPDVLKPRSVKKTIPIIIKTLANEFSKYDAMKAANDDIQSHLRKTIGISSESGTSHGIYDNPAYVISRTKEQKESMQVNNISEIDKLFGITTAHNAARILNPDSQHRKAYMLLDSRYCNEKKTVENVENGNTVRNIVNFSWDISFTLETPLGSNINKPVRDVIALRIYPSRIPYVESADNKYSRISVYIENYDAQAFIAHERRKFHFMLQSQIDTSFINLETNKYNDGFVYFDKPLALNTRFTIDFASPIEPIIFDNDEDDAVFDYFGIAPLTQVTTTFPHNLDNGDRVYFTNFKVGDVPAILVNQQRINNEIRDTINRASGFLITVIDDYNFSIDYDSSNIQNPVDEPTTVFYGSKRIFLPLEITYIMPELNTDL